MADAPITDAVPLTVLIATVWRHRVIAVLAGLVVVVAAVLLSYAVTPMFRAEALLVVEHGGKPLTFLGDDVDAKGAEFSLLNTQSELLMSHQVVSQVLTQERALFDASPAYAHAQDRTRLLTNRLKIDTNQYSWILHLSLVDGDPVLAQAALTALIHCHLGNERRRIEDRSRSALDFLRLAVAKARDDLARCRSEEASFRRGNGLLSADPDRNLLTLELEALHASRIALETEIASGEATMAGLAAGATIADAVGRNAMLMRIPGINRDPQVVQLQQSLLVLKDRTFALSQKYKPDHPQMLDVANLLGSAQAQFDQAVAMAGAGLDESRQTLVRRLHQLRARIATTEAGLAAYRERIIDLQALSLKTASTELLYQTVDRNLQEEEIASHRQQLVVTVADPPHVTSWPVNVRRSLFGLAGLFLGLIAAVGAGLIAEFFDRRIRHHQAVRQITGLPTLGYIPHVDRLEFPGSPDAASASGHGTIDEAFRLLSSTIQLSREIGPGPRVMVVTSPASGDGRTTVAARLAMTLAASGSRVLLIDGDLRQPGLHHQFDLPEETGVSDLLQGREAVVVPTGYPCLELLSAGTTVERSMELPSIASFRELLNTFAGNNRFIIIDSPPLEFSEALVMCGVAHDVLLVIRDGYTDKEALRLAQVRLDPLLGKVLGLIINDDHGTAPVSRGADSRISQTAVFTRRNPPKPGAPGPEDPVVIEGV